MAARRLPIADSCRCSQREAERHNGSKKYMVLLIEPISLILELVSLFCGLAYFKIREIRTNRAKKYIFWHIQYIEKSNLFCYNIKKV